VEADGGPFGVAAVWETATAFEPSPFGGTEYGDDGTSPFRLSSATVHLFDLAIKELSVHNFRWSVPSSQMRASRLIRTKNAVAAI
jgi:hypothetical protein